MRIGETRTKNPFKLHVHGRGEGRANVGVVGGQRERATSVVLNTVVPRKSKTEWICRRLIGSSS